MYLLFCSLLSSSRQTELNSTCHSLSFFASFIIDFQTGWTELYIYFFLQFYCHLLGRLHWILLVIHYGSVFVTFQPDWTLLLRLFTSVFLSSWQTFLHLLGTLKLHPLYLSTCIPPFCICCTEWHRHQHWQWFTLGNRLNCNFNACNVLSRHTFVFAAHFCLPSRLVIFSADFCLRRTFLCSKQTFVIFSADCTGSHLQGRLCDFSALTDRNPYSSKTTCINTLFPLLDIPI